MDNANEISIDPQQMQFLENELKKNFKFKFVMLHVPIFEPSNYQNYVPMFIRDGLQVYHSLADRENANQFMKLMDNYNVTAVFTSHLHGYFKEEKNRRSCPSHRR